MNFDWLDNALWKPIGKGLSEADTFMRREMPLGMSWGAPAAALGAYFAAPAIASSLGGEGLAGLGSAAEQQAIMDSGGAFSLGDLGGMSGNQYIDSQLAGLGPEAYTQGGAFNVPMGYGDNLGALGFNTAAEQEAIMNSGGAFSGGDLGGMTGNEYIDSQLSGSYDLPTMDINPATGMPWQETGSGYAGGAADQYGSSIDDFLKEKGLVGKEKGFDIGKALASALKGMGGQKKAVPQQYVMQQLQNRNQQQQQVQNNVNQLGMPVIPTSGIVQEPNAALAQMLRRNRYA